MKIKGKKMAAALSVVCVLQFMAAGCGAAAAETTKVNEEVAEGTETSGSAGVDAALDTTVQGTDSAMDAKTDETDTAEGQSDAPTGTSQTSEGRWHVFAPDVAAAVDADFEGTVRKIDAESFYIVETTVELMENGEILSAEASPEAQIPESDLIQVVFEESTRFYIRSIYANEARYEDSEAAFTDLEQNMPVELKGEFIGDIFHAKEVRMVQIE